MMAANEREKTNAESELFQATAKVVYPSEIKIFEKGDYQLLLYKIYDYFDRKTQGNIFINLATFLTGCGADGIYSYINTNKQLALVDLLKGLRAAWIYIALLLIGVAMYLFVLHIRAKNRDKDKNSYITRFIDEGKTGSNPISIQIGSCMNNSSSHPFDTTPPSN